MHHIPARDAPHLSLFARHHPPHPPTPLHPAQDALLTLNIVDRYVSRQIAYTKHYQLVRCAALWVAAKFEDAKERVPTLTDLVQICRETYDESAFIQMEGHVLATIQWTLGHPTAEAWLRFYCCCSFEESAHVQHVARFLMEITPFYRDFIECVLSLPSYISFLLDQCTYSLAGTMVFNNWPAKHVADLSETPEEILISL